MELLISYFDSENSIYDMIEDSVDISQLDSLANDTTTFGYIIARALMTKLFGTQYHELFLTSDEEEHEERLINPELKKESVEHKLVLFPNPSSGEVTVEYNLADTGGILEIFNSIGELVKTVLLNANEQRKTFTMEGSPNGVYTVKVIGNGKYINAIRLCLITN